MINDKEDECCSTSFESLLNRYQKNLEKLMKGIEFVFYYYQLLYYKSHNTNLNGGGSYLHFLDWIKK